MTDPRGEEVTECFFFQIEGVGFEGLKVTSEVEKGRVWEAVAKEIEALEERLGAELLEKLAAKVTNGGCLWPIRLMAMAGPLCVDMHPGVASS